MTLAKAVYKSGRELVSAFQKEALPKELFLLSRYGKVDPPWAPPLPGSGAEEYAAAWTRGYDGGPMRGAFRWLGLQGAATCLAYLPKTHQKRGRPPKSPPLSDFASIPEVERMIKYVIRNGAAIHDVRDLVAGFRHVWEDLDKTRPDTWATEDLVELLDERSQKSKDPDAIAPSMLFLWNSSNHPFHAKQVERTEKILFHGLRAVLPGSHRAPK